VTALSDLERRDRAMSEIELQRLIVGKDGLAPMLGWEHVHWRAAQTEHGWRTPASGTMAAGWPDLVLVRIRDRRLIFAELKKEQGQLSPDQWRVMTLLGAIAGTTRAGDNGPMLSVETYVWRPSDLRDPVEQSAIYRALR
jgi:hypothetical protein